MIHFDGHGFSGEPDDARVDTVALVGDERLVVVDVYPVPDAEAEAEDE